MLDVKYFNLLPTVSDVGTAIDDLQWSSLLLAISGFEAYRRQHHMIQIPKVVEFFLFNPKFPRSVSYCVQQADHSLREVLDRPIDQLPGPAEHVSSALVHRLNHTGVKEVLAGGMHQFVDQLQRELNQLGDAISQELFHAQPA
ncbi:MAG: alpha-E domain-containing protein [Planctomycetota bacterium]